MSYSIYSRQGNDPIYWLPIMRRLQLHEMFVIFEVQKYISL